MIRKSYAALRNLVTSLPNPNPDPNPMLSSQVESESEKPARIRFAGQIFTKISRKKNTKNKIFSNIVLTNLIAKKINISLVGAQ